MADNDEILNELFGRKKKGFSEKNAAKLGNYEPVKKTSDIKMLINGNATDGVVVSDAKEVQKRLVGALGMAMGANNIRSMASRSVKNFPIIVSDDVAPETLVMIKTAMEEEYASYIDLLVSNQIIDITEYDPDSQDGNIAIQALDRLSGADFGKGRIARQAASGSLTVDDMMRNNPGWQFIRSNEDLEYRSGNPILDELLENAVIVPTKYAPSVENMLMEGMTEANEATIGLEEKYQYAPVDLGSRDIERNDADIAAALRASGVQNANAFGAGDAVVNVVTSVVYTRDANGTWKPSGGGSKSPQKRVGDIFMSDLNGNSIASLRYRGGMTVRDPNQIDRDMQVQHYSNEYNKLLSPNAMVRGADIQTCLDDSVAAFLNGEHATDAKSREIAAIIRDRFTKASYLLASNRISGAEYISYLVDRLGIPVSKKNRTDILIRYPESNVVFKGTQMYDGLSVADGELVNAMRSKIRANERNVLSSVVPKLTTGDVRHILGASAIGAGLGGASGAGIGAAAGMAAFNTLALFTPIGLGVLAGAAVGGLGTAIYQLFKAKKKKKALATRIEGWERVEQLIDEMDFNSADAAKHALAMKASNKPDDDKIADFRREDEKQYNEFYRNMASALSKVVVAEDITDIRGYISKEPESYRARLLETAQALDECIREDDGYVAELESLNEASKYIINTRRPGDVKIKPVKINPKEIASAIPAFGTKGTMAYGSVEYDRKDLKDRKFNEPLILTIKFKERYDDGRTSDSELTAVIGILGVITRVPSAEMRAVLEANAEGKSIAGVFSADQPNSSKDLVSNVLSAFMGTKYADRLPTSGKIWSNLEKITSLAVANKLAGSNNGNISNAHIVFSQKEINEAKNSTGVDYLKDARLTAQLMRKYSAFKIIVADDALQILSTFGDQDAISWDEAPYSAYLGKSNSDTMLNVLTQMKRNML